MELAEIKQAVRENQQAGRQSYDGLSSVDIGRYNQAIMFGVSQDQMPAILAHMYDVGFNEMILIGPPVS